MDGFLAGLLLGIFLGLLLGPVLRSWIVWRSIEGARREAALADAILARMNQPDDESPNDPPDDDARRS